MLDVLRFRGVPPILHGPGASSKLHSELQGKLLLVSDPGLHKAGVLGQLGVEAKVHLLEQGEPKVEVLDQLAEAIRKECPDWTVGVGGGSVLDTVKLASCVAADNQPTESYALCAADLPRATTKRVLIPTTSGTGSEVTRTSIFTDTRGHKVWAWGSQLGADLVVLDATLTLGLPRLLTCLTSLDAVAHALESFVSPRCDLLGSSFCLQALRLAGTHLPNLARRLDNLEARQGMLLASTFAGLGIDLFGTGVAHAGSHAAATAVGSGHAEGVVWAMPVALRWNRESERYAQAAKVLLPGCHDIEKAWSELREPWGSLPRPQKLTLPALVEALAAAENRPMLDNNHRPVGEKQLEELATLLLEVP